MKAFTGNRRLPPTDFNNMANSEQWEGDPTCKQQSIMEKRVWLRLSIVNNKPHYQNDSNNFTACDLSHLGFPWVLYTE